MVAVKGASTRETNDKGCKLLLTRIVTTLSTTTIARCKTGVETVGEWIVRLNPFIPLIKERLNSCTGTRIWWIRIGARLRFRVISKPLLAFQIAIFFTIRIFESVDPPSRDICISNKIIDGFNSSSPRPVKQNKRQFNPISQRQREN